MSWVGDVTVFIVWVDILCKLSSDSLSDSVLFNDWLVGVGVLGQCCSTDRLGDEDEELFE